MAINQTNHRTKPKTLFKLHHWHSSKLIAGAHLFCQLYPEVRMRQKKKSIIQHSEPEEL